MSTFSECIKTPARMTRDACHTLLGRLPFCCATRAYANTECFLISSDDMFVVAFQQMKMSLLKIIWKALWLRSLWIIAAISTHKTEWPLLCATKQFYKFRTSFAFTFVLFRLAFIQWIGLTGINGHVTGWCDRKEAIREFFLSKWAHESRADHQCGCESTKRPVAHAPQLIKF